MFEPTSPADESGLDRAAGLQRVSEFRRHHEGVPTVVDTGAGITRLSSLNPSLLQDLMRFDASARPGEGLEMLEVLAAAVRHSRALLLHVEHEHRVIPVTLFPIERQVHAPLKLKQLLDLSLPDLRVLHVEPARINAADHDKELSPLGRVVWGIPIPATPAPIIPDMPANLPTPYPPAA